MPNDTDPPVQYLFIVARNHPDILARVQQRLGGDPRTEIVVDRRIRERRRSDARAVPDQRRGDRRRPTRYWDDLSVNPTLFVQKRVELYAELQRREAASTEENRHLRDELASLRTRLEALAAADQEHRAENARLRAEVSILQGRLETLETADAALRADAAAVMVQTEEALGAVIERLRAFAPPGRRPDKEPRLRSA